MKKKVLIIDSHAPFRAVFRKLLEHDPIMGEILEVDNLKNAIQKVKEFSPTLIFMDLELLNNGLTLLREIQDFLINVKVVILAVHSKKSFVEKALQLGASGYLLKKNLNKELDEALKMIESGHQYISKDIRMNTI